MARYDYHCPSCGAVFEVEHPMSEHPDVTCPSCGANAERVFSASAITFQGHGFYNTDQRGAGASGAGKASPKPASKGSAAPAATSSGPASSSGSPSSSATSD